MDPRDEKLLTTPIPDFDAPAALARLRERAAREHVVHTPRLTDRLARLFTRPPARALAAALGAVVIVLALGVSGVADTILTVFEPQRIATVQISPGELAGIPDPSQYGTLTWLEKPSFQPAADASAAASAAGFTPLVPSSLPAGIPSAGRFAVMPEAKATFSFDEAKAAAAAAAAKAGRTAPPMPADVASTTLTMTGGPAVVQHYGGASAAAPDATPLSQSGLILLQAKAPVVTSNGATVNELRDYALAQPGVPPALAAQIRAIGDPVRTLMLPIGVDPQQAQVVTVRGTQGYLVTMGTHSAVFWLENGYVVAAGGALTQSDLLALVNGLH